MLTTNIQVEGVASLTSAIEKYIATFNKDMREVIQSTAKQLASDFMDYTPPFVNQLPGVKTNVMQKAAGEKKAMGDVKRAILPSANMLKGPTRNKALAKLIERRDAKGITELAKHFHAESPLRYWEIKRNFDKFDHLNFRKFGAANRYHVPKQISKMTLNNRGHEMHSKRIAKRVGFLKAGWGLSVVALGGSVPGWVKRHIGYAKGVVTIDNPMDERISVIVNNYSKTVTRYKKGYDIAVRTRAGKIAKAAQIRANYNLKKFGLIGGPPKAT